VTATETEQSQLSRSEAASAAALARPAGGVRILAVRDGSRVEVRGLDDLPTIAGDSSTLVWVDLVEPAAEIANLVGAALGIHELVIEDLLERNQRSKIEFIEDDVHIVMFALAFDQEPTDCEIDIVLGHRFLVTVHDDRWDPYAVTRVRANATATLARGPDYLLYVLADAIVDDYFPVLDRIGDEIDQLEDDVVTEASPATLQRLFVMKRGLIELRRVTAPSREILNQLTDRQLTFVDPGHVLYFRDVYDHLIRVTDEIDSYRELVAGTLDVYLSTVNNNLSQIMKRLTGVTVILAGIGAVAGIFGMSEAATALASHEARGFWEVTVLVFALAAAVAVILRRIDWI
jgi:magnesium transporter